MNAAFTKHFLLIGTVIGISVTGAFLWTMWRDGWWWGDSLSADFIHAQTVAFTALVFVQLVNAFSSRSKKVSIFQQNPFENNFLVVAILFSILMVLLMIYVPFLNQVLGTSPLNAVDWGTVGMASLIPLLVIEWKKWRMRRMPNAMVTL